MYYLAFLNYLNTSLYPLFWLIRLFWKLLILKHALFQSSVVKRLCNIIYINVYFLSPEWPIYFHFNVYFKWCIVRVVFWFWAFAKVPWHTYNEETLFTFWVNIIRICLLPSDKWTQLIEWIEFQTVKLGRKCA